MRMSDAVNHVLFGFFGKIGKCHFDVFAVLTYDGTVFLDAFEQIGHRAIELILPIE